MVVRLIGFLVLSLNVLLFAEEQPSQSQNQDPVKTEIISEGEFVSLKEPISLLLTANLAPEWHLYWKNPGDSGMAPQVTWELPQGVEVKNLAWPTPARFDLNGIVTFGYEEKAQFLAELTVSDPSLKEIPVKGKMTWVACSGDSCLPGESAFETVVKLGEPSPKNPQFEQVRKELPKKALQGTTSAKDHLVMLAIHENECKELLTGKLTFFPEEGEWFDHQQEVTWTQGENSQMLIAIASNGKLPSRVKGLLTTEKGALEVDFPLAQEAQAVALTTPALNKELIPAQEDEALSFGWAILFAFVGGSLLNLMPCVLPVISLKIMSFVKMAGESRKEVFKHGLSFSAGILCSFWALAAILMVLQVMGNAVGWGFQLQDPLVIAGMAGLFTLLGLSLFGVFEIGTSVASVFGEKTMKATQSGYLGSFISGVFATAVATPCTGPFMGSALGYALTQSPLISFAVFTSLALGMAAPYLLLSYYPQLMKWLPKPGAWMESFKQFMGFFMFATVIWFLWVFVGQTTEQALFILLTALLLVTLGAWAYGRFSTPINTKKVRQISTYFAAVCLGLGLILAHHASSSDGTHSSHRQEIAEGDWETFSPERLAELRAQGTPVLIDFTAKWCLICQANHMVLSKGNVEKKFADKGVVRMKADWTKRDPVITAELQKHGRSGVPLYVLYGEEEKATILPQLLTSDVLISSLETLPDKNVR